MQNELHVCVKGREGAVMFVSSWTAHYMKTLWSSFFSFYQLCGYQGNRGWPLLDSSKLSVYVCVCVCVHLLLSVGCFCLQIYPCCAVDSLHK